MSHSAPRPAPIQLRQARVLVAGLGLMGGSLALALRDQCAERLGADVDPAVVALALTRGAIDRAATLAAAPECDLVVLAAPVRAILAQLAGLPPLPPGRRVVVMDVGSTKGEILAAMQALPAGYDPVGGHPMCGKAESGLGAAEAGLYAGRVFALLALKRTSPAALQLATEVLSAIGARPLLAAPQQHDRAAAAISHVPYLAAAGLVRAAEALGSDLAWQLAAAGFRDSTRLAASDLTMMIDILLTNRPAVLTALGEYQAQLNSLAACLEGGDAAGLRALLEPARERRQGLFGG